MRLTRWQNAYDDITTIFEVIPDPAYQLYNWPDRCCALLEMGLQIEALADANGLIEMAEKYPKHADSLVTQFMLQNKIDQFPDAMLALAHQAVQRHPNSNIFRGELGGVQFYLGEYSDAVENLEPTSADSPSASSASSGFWLAMSLHHLGKTKEAEAAFRKAEQLAPTISFASEIGFIQLREGGDSAAALAEINREDDESLRAYYLAASYAFLGRRADADATLARYQKEHEANHPYNMARLHAWRAESNEAFEWLDRAYQQHDDNLHWIKTDRSFENFRSDPRYKAFLRKMNLPE